MLKIEYDKIVPNWQQYILDYGYMTSKLEVKFLGRINEKRTELKHFSFLTMRCVTFEIPFVKDITLAQFWIAVNYSIFDERNLGKRINNPSDHLFSENQFIVSPHYQNQLLGDIVTGIRKWPSRTDDSPKNYVMQFNIRSVEILESRDKDWAPCIPGAPDIDDRVRQAILERIRCKPPYWNSTSSMPLCSTFEEMNMTAEMITNVAFGHVSRRKILGTLPCRRLKKIEFLNLYETPHPDDFQWKDEISLWFQFKEQTYKEVKNIRSMNKQALIGN